MAEEVKVPQLGESVTEATIGQWFKKVGEAVSQDEPIVELETDKVAMEVNAPIAGVISELVVGEGDTVEVGALIAMIDANGKAAAPAPTPAPAQSKPEANGQPAEAPAPAAPAPAPQPSAAPASDIPLAPAVRRIVE
ncbi:MAG: biotin/lipoyl-containing protein, partial [Pseudomonadota bacterium]